MVRPDNAPPGGRKLISTSFSRLANATSLTFVDDGDTGESPRQDRSPYQLERYGDRWAPVLVTWATTKEVPDFAVDIAGEAGSQRIRRPDGGYAFVTGSVALDATAFRTMIDDGDTRTARAIVQHELGHLVGLSHVDDPTQLMYPRAQTTVGDYGDGDLEGLVRLGTGPCVPDL